MPEATKTVLIHCKLKRTGGSRIDLHGRIYHFKPAADDKSEEPQHVCAIPFTEAAAIHRLLRIKEAYELVDPTAELPPVPDAPVNTQTMAADSASGKPAEKPLIIDDGQGNTYNLTEMGLEEVKLLAKEQFGISCHAKWNKTTVATKIMEKLRSED